MPFWLAIWVIDFSYYNRLLIGSVAAILALEEHSKTHKTISSIELSTLVENSVSTGIPFALTKKQKFRLTSGRWAFYTIVMIALFAGAVFSFYTYMNSPDTIIPKTQERTLRN
jgi:hypothetical protein